MTPKTVDYENALFDDAHINKDRQHNVTAEEARSFIKNAKVSATVWNGEFERYYSVDGVVYFKVEQNLIRSAFKPKEFNDTLKSMVFYWSL